MAKAKRAARARRAVRVPEVGEVFGFRVDDGRFGACQVLSRSPDSDQVEIATLDYLSDEPPSVAGLRDAKVLRQDWAAWRGDPARCFVDARVPWWAEPVGVMPLVETFPGGCKSYGGWASAFGAYNRARWLASTRGRQPAGRDDVTIDLGGGPAVLRTSTTRVHLGPEGNVRTSASGPVGWEALDALPELWTVVYAGPDAGVVELVARRGTHELTWLGHGASTIDVRDTDLERLTLDVRAPLWLRVGQGLHALTLRGRADLVTIEGARTDAPFLLQIVGPTITAPPRGAQDTQRVDLLGLVETDTSGLTGYTRLADLGLHGAPGRLTDVTGLAHVAPSLRELSVSQLYALDGARWPVEWPALEEATLHGLRRADADAIKAALDAVPHVRVTGARTDAWIAANLDNPFREWEEDDLALGRAACAAWKKAKTKAVALGASASAADAEAVLAELVRALNRLDGRHGLDTVRREEAGEAFSALASSMGVDDARAEAWFDAWRDF